MIINRQIQPEIKLVKGLAPANPEKIHLDNGIPVYLIDKSSQDIVKIEFVLGAGRWYESKKLSANFTNKMLKEGTKNLTAKEIADKIDFYGAHLETSSDKDNAFVTLYTLNKYLEKTLEIAVDIMFNPIFPEKELDILKQNRKQHFIINNEKVRYIAKQKFGGLIFGEEHPYGRSYDIEDFDDINREDLVNLHSKYYNTDNCKIIIAGMVRSDLVTILNNIFSNLVSNRSTTGRLNGVYNKSLLPQKQKIKKQDAVQSAIRIGKLLFNKKHPDYASLKILNTVLGGYFGSRLMTNIREDKGYTYGIGSAIVSMRNSGYFFIASEVGSGVTEKALKEVYREIERLQNDLIPDNELELVKNYILGSLLRSFDGAFGLAENFKNLIDYDLDFSYFEQFIRLINSITSENLRDLAQQYLDPVELTELTVGN